MLVDVIHDWAILNLNDVPSLFDVRIFAESVVVAAGDRRWCQRTADIV